MFQPAEKKFDLVAFEHEILRYWSDSQAFEKLRQQNADGPRWSFLDGPITANNPMGVHHAWGRTLKDCYQRYHAMLGHHLRYQNGFDCQGLWVEVEVEKEHGFACKRDIETFGLDRFIDACKARVRKFSRLQTEQSVRLGYWMDWSDSYFTMADENNYTIWAFLKKCHQRGLIYKGLDAMPWCPRCGTGISEQEMKEGYADIDDVAVFLKLRLRDAPGEHLLVWTTTPWTLAANVACAVHPDLPYVKVRQGDEVYYLGRDLQAAVAPNGKYEVLEELPGSALVGRLYEGPFDHLPRPGEIREAHRVVAWDQVLAGEGSGIVHIAPGCGKEDFDLGKELGLPVLAPIDDEGVYMEGYGFLTGQFAGDVADQILDGLRQQGNFHRSEVYRHSYPHCWRCRTKLLFRAVDEWYISMSWRDEIKEVARQIQWIPEYGLDLELDWLTNMGDWMISKKRYWGLALPIFACPCGHFDVIGSREELKERSVAGWEEFEGHSPHRPWVDQVEIACSACGQRVRRIPDVGNPWLDAGIVPYSTVRYREDRDYWKEWIPADLVLECFPGQFRNWFYALLAMSTMMENLAPFRTLLGHALVRDEEGHEMHKTLGNAIWFDDAAEQMGVDSMRWLFCRQNPTMNLNFGYGVTDQIKRRVFNTLWNVYSFFTSYARSDQFDPSEPPVPLTQRQDIDRWLLSKLQQLARTGNEGLARYDAPVLVREAEQFIDALSTWYVRRCRRRFWRPRSSDDTDKRAAYQTLHETLAALCRLLAPVAPFLTEKLYQNLVRSVDPDAPESVHHTRYPQPDPALEDARLASDMDLAMRVVSAALGARESRSLRVRQPLRQLIFVAEEEGTRQAAQRFRDHILEELNVKDLQVEASLDGFVEYQVRTNARLLGPKYGKDLPLLGQALSQLDARQVASTVAEGKAVSVELGDGRRAELLADEVQVERRFPDHLVAAEDRGFQVLLDVTVTPELEREGYARDLVRHIQTLRKELDLELTDRIRITCWTEDAALSQVLEEHGDYICGETLAAGMQSGDGPAGKEVVLSGHAIHLDVTRL